MSESVFEKSPIHHFPFFEGGFREIIRAVSCVPAVRLSAGMSGRKDFGKRIDPSDNLKLFRKTKPDFSVWHSFEVLT